MALLTAGLLFWGGEVAPGAQMVRTEPAMFSQCFGGSKLDDKNKPDSLALPWNKVLSVCGCCPSMCSPWPSLWMQDAK